MGRFLPNVYLFPILAWRIFSIASGVCLYPNPCLFPICIGLFLPVRILRIFSLVSFEWGTPLFHACSGHSWIFLPISLPHFLQLFIICMSKYDPHADFASCSCATSVCASCVPSASTSTACGCCSCRACRVSSSCSASTTKY